MLRNRSLQVKVVKDEPPTYDTTVEGGVDAVSDLIAKNAKPTAVAFALVIAANTLSKIALHTAQTYIK